MGSEKTENKQQAEISELVQNATQILIEELTLTKEEALNILYESAAEELKERGITYDQIEQGSAPVRQAFVRKIIYRVEKKVRAIITVPKRKVEAAIERFFKYFQEWNQESPEDASLDMLE
ncbi:MAG: hypothetical protein AAF518_27390 [Spirochaetota bacterium]